jgi:hypothetical protein
VERGAAQRHDPVEAEQGGEQKLVGTPTHQAGASLGKSVARGDRTPMTTLCGGGQIHSEDQFGQMAAELSIGFRECRNCRFSWTDSRPAGTCDQSLPLLLLNASRAQKRWRRECPHGKIRMIDPTRRWHLKRPRGDH